MANERLDKCCTDKRVPRHSSHESCSAEIGWIVNFRRHGGDRRIDVEAVEPAHQLVVDVGNRPRVERHALGAPVVDGHDELVIDEVHIDREAGPAAQIGEVIRAVSSMCSACCSLPARLYAHASRHELSAGCSGKRSAIWIA